MFCRKNLSLLGQLVSTAFLFAWSHQTFAKQFVLKIDNSHPISETVKQIKNNKKIKILEIYENGRLVLVESEDDKQINAMTRSFDSGVSYGVENIKFHAFNMPNDPKVTEQWALSKVNAAGAWSQTVGSRDVVVAVIDTGIDWKHEDLKDSIWANTKEVPGNSKDDDANGYVDDVKGWDFRDNDGDPMDETSQQNPGHGTHCAGIVGGIGDNGVGISGMSQRVSLMPVRFLGADGSGDLMSAAKAIDYAVNNGAHIISASWGAATSRSGVGPILEAIQRAADKGVIFVAAAANDGKNNDMREVYPANAGLDNMISVAASNSNDGKPQWSNYGKMNVHLASPGENIVSTLPQNKYGSLSGTSMATPLVSGLVALMLTRAKETGRELAANHYRAILQSTGTKVEIETACNCRVDAAAALTNIADDQLTVVPNAATFAEQETKQFAAIGGQEPYTFTSSNPAIGTISESGEFVAKAKGETVVTVTDKSGTQAVSRVIYIGKEASAPGQTCPLQNEMMCMIMCLLDPTLPWCPGQ